MLNRIFLGRCTQIHFFTCPTQAKNLCCGFKSKLTCFYECLPNFYQCATFSHQFMKLKVHSPKPLNYFSVESCLIAAVECFCRSLIT